MSRTFAKALSAEILFSALGRIVIGSYFVAKSCGLIVDPNGVAEAFSAGMVPGFFVIASVIFEFTAAFMVMVGFQTRIAASVLALHVFWTAFIFTYVPGDAAAISHFWRDLAMVGGLLMVATCERTLLMIDGLLSEREAAAPMPRKPERGDAFSRLRRARKRDAAAETRASA
ncbi:DoxX family protein [Rhodovulum sp. YNF3179]|uniref:DoxX family protein n=1 Tax=Rhodovulum sp. YNF3179 TaxID=3425127 RepID=UPI003D3503D5